MKPLITTAAVLRELATGLTPVGLEPESLFEYDAAEYQVHLSAADESDSQQVIIIRDGNHKERHVPDHLSEHRRDVLSRMASFAERARAAGPLALPRGWHQFKHHNLIAFFAVPGREAATGTRWIAEVVPGERSDVIFWRATTADDKLSLEEFERAKPALPSSLAATWDSAKLAAAEYFSTSVSSVSADVEITLPILEQSPSKGWSYETWLASVSNDQKSFIEAPTNRSIRLRGPAGSGKTLAITLKVVREVLAAREAGAPIRVLVATHSWGLAAQIDESLRSMGLGSIPEVDVFPLLEIAQAMAPQYVADSSGFSLIGEDSYSGKRAQLDEILEIVQDFVDGDWVTFKHSVSDSLRTRLDSTAEDDRLALAWDLLVEFGSVIGASAIFPGAGSEARYQQLPRASWMLPLASAEDRRVVFHLYTLYMASLDARSLVTSDQVLADFLSHLETHAWNRARRSQGYDLIFVDEFHLFSPLERQVLHYLTRDVATYPRVFMAVDPRQSPSEAFIGVAADETRSTAWSDSLDNIGDVTNFELTTVHRFTPEILELIKHVHHEFPTLDLGHDWHIDFGSVESAQASGPVPQLISAASRAGEQRDIASAIHDLYPHGRLALAIVDARQWERFSDFASRMGQSAKFHVSTITGRSDVEGLGYRRRGLVVAPAEYLAGLQFDTVLVAGIPDMQVARTANERTRLLSILYLSLSRAEREVRVFVNEDDGPAEVLQRAVSNGLMTVQKGSLV